MTVPSTARWHSELLLGSVTQGVLNRRLAEVLIVYADRDGREAA